jgi:Domain of unknown function (DUF4279)
MDPHEITTALGLSPKRSWMVGEPKTTPTGQRLEGINRKTYWTANFGGEKPRFSEQTDLTELLSDLTIQLRPAKDFMRAFVESGGEIKIFIGLFCPKNSGVGIPWELLKRFATLRIGVDFDYYPGKP